MTIEQILEGAFDMHVHTYPEFSEDFISARDDFDNIALAKEYGMKGLVLKSHTFPTLGKARILDRVFPDVNVLGSITLNQVNGGIDPVSVEVALKTGCKVVHMPTWSSKYDLGNNVAFFLMQKYIKSSHELTEEKDGISIYDENGNVSEKTMKVLQLIKEHDACVFTGHMGTEEAIKTLEVCQELGISKAVFGHPLAMGKGTPMELVHKALATGAYVEFTHLIMIPEYCHMPVDKQLEQIKALVEKYGADRFILCSDHFDGESPLAPDGLKAFVDTLYKNGIAPEDLRKMIVDNPYKLLGI
ncbi:DUF6282 family protein [Clostridium sp.]|uniref:DUF6282 family protein n=1 Tax=Clostridium sp. TaxID=1506 RepID=UPI002FDEC3F6